MVELIPPPDPRTVIPPLLACLPTAFVSPRPPPALLSLLSPILRQRVQVLSSVSASPTESWLRLLCWDADKAERLQTLVDGTSFEPHPVSGEIDLPEEISVTYKRIDEETLQSRILLNDYGLTILYLWCPQDEEAGGPGWRVAELLPQDGQAVDDTRDWSDSIGEANVRAKEQLMEDALKSAEKYEKAVAQDSAKDDEHDNDDDYWAQYDTTPRRTPSAKTPAPNILSSFQRETSEATYFSRYAEVQPAMDNHDPSEQQPRPGLSSLNGNILASILQNQINGSEPQDDAASRNGEVTNGHDPMPLNHPLPSSASSGSSDAVAKLEREAENQSSCEVGVKQHIGSNIKSLFRLAKATGISRAEFQSLVRTELELLDVSDYD
ncbi:hypothetical protein EYZ11_008557 [Aspergillus tanneri]|uniref:Uncharacterized protein n=1 Tax=Aspergillus tanneri TaxID=1220188 RepID=A0A4S3JAC2_9EURO|nr:uncharacterized protein ATNIH1004_011185 [Aspergillus tanneri]KAA8642244.1 hypothetical protein ATNIH1004_011185 [Aspergillus tanneri]THC91970.1 hypothetical protein EYZ11_008557 [Aspergillus tanneri]